MDEASARSWIVTSSAASTSQPATCTFSTVTPTISTWNAQRFERAIAAAGGIDLLVLGIGANGHIGFNEPGAALFARTHRARLTAATRRANAGLFAGRPAMVPREALSMGMATILAARAIVLVATGRSKARAIKAMLSGRITPSLPASFLQLHHEVRLMLDKAAAERL